MVRVAIGTAERRYVDGVVLRVEEQTQSSWEGGCH